MLNTAVWKRVAAMIICAATVALSGCSSTSADPGEITNAPKASASKLDEKPGADDKDADANGANSSTIVENLLSKTLGEYRTIAKRCVPARELDECKTFSNKVLGDGKAITLANALNADLELREGSITPNKDSQLDKYKVDLYYGQSDQAYFTFDVVLVDAKTLKFVDGQWTDAGTAWAFSDPNNPRILYE